MAIHDPSTYVGQEDGWCMCDQPSGQPGQSCEACGGAILEPIDRMKRHLERATRAGINAHAWELYQQAKGLRPISITRLRVGHRCQQTLCGCAHLDGLPLMALTQPPPFHEDCDCYLETETASED